MGGLGNEAPGDDPKGTAMTVLQDHKRRDDSDVSWALGMLRCPASGSVLVRDDQELLAPHTGRRYRITPDGIPLFAEEVCSEDARRQEAHYEKIAGAYVANLGYPHTRAYMKYLDDLLLKCIPQTDLGTVAEICCGAGDGFTLLSHRIGRGIGVDVSVAMLRNATHNHPQSNFAFVQGDATMLPLGSECCDSVVMLGGIHHVRDRAKLFMEVSRILKPGGRFFFREPVSDFVLWRALRAVIYRFSPVLDHTTERPLLYRETEPVLEQAGLSLTVWRTAGFLGFCLFMNSDVLVFNRLFRFIPGIAAITRLAARLDEWTIRIPGFRRAGLQVIGVAEKKAHRA